MSLAGMSPHLRTLKPTNTHAGRRKESGRSGILPCLQASSLACHDVRDAAEDTRLPGQRQRIVLLTATAVARVSPQAPAPRDPVPTDQGEGGPR